MKFLDKRFIPVDNIDKTKAIFIVGEAQDGLSHYVALIDLYNVEDRWVEIMSISNVSADPTVEAKPTFQGTLRHIENDEEWRTAVTCFNDHRVFDEYDWNAVEKNIVDQRIRKRLEPYQDWWFDMKKGQTNLPDHVKKNIDAYKRRFKASIINDTQGE